MMEFLHVKLNLYGNIENTFQRWYVLKFRPELHLDSPNSVIQFDENNKQKNWVKISLKSCMYFQRMVYVSIRCRDVQSHTCVKAEVQDSTYFAYR